MPTNPYQPPSIPAERMRPWRIRRAALMKGIALGAFIGFIACAVVGNLIMWLFVI